jgi:hypothetical protein
MHPNEDVHATFVSVEPVRFCCLIMIRSFQLGNVVISLISANPRGTYRTSCFGFPSLRFNKYFLESPCIGTVYYRKN